MSHCQEWLGSGSSGEGRVGSGVEWRGVEGRGGEGRGGYVTVHALHQVTQPHHVCLLTDAGEGVSYSCSWKGVLATLGFQAPPLHVRGCGRGQGSCSRSWEYGYLWGKGRRRVRQSLVQMICTVGTSSTHPLPSPLTIV